MAEVDHVDAANAALAATKSVPQGRDPSFVQAHATVALAHATLALLEHVRGDSPRAHEAPPSKPNAAKSPELGNIVQAVTVQLGDSVYHLERYENNTILVLNASIPKYEEVTKPVLRRINDELDLRVNINRANGEQKNTRTLGRDVIRALVEQNKTIPQ